MIVTRGIQTNDNGANHIHIQDRRYRCVCNGSVQCSLTYMGYGSRRTTWMSLLTSWQIWSTFFSFHGIWEEKTYLTDTRQCVTWVCDVINWKLEEESLFQLFWADGWLWMQHWFHETQLTTRHIARGRLLFHNDIECVYVTWEGSAGLPIPVTTMLHYFIIICSYSWPPTEMHSSSRIMYCVIRSSFPKLVWWGLWKLLINGAGHHVHPKLAQQSIYEVWWKVYSYTRFCLYKY